MDVETQVGEHQGPRRPMQQNHLLQAKAEHEKAVDLALPRGGWLISERGVKVERLPTRRSAGSGQELGRGVALRNPIGEPSVRSRNHDEADLADRVEFLLEFGRDRDRRMENELSVGEPKHRHANGNGNQPGRPGELMLGAPEIRGVSD